LAIQTSPSSTTITVAVPSSVTSTITTVLTHTLC
jgi:hypothetical protein